MYGLFSNRINQTTSIVSTVMTTTAVVCVWPLIAEGYARPLSRLLVSPLADVTTDSLLIALATGR